MAFSSQTTQSNERFNQKSLKGERIANYSFCNKSYFLSCILFSFLFFRFPFSVSSLLISIFLLFAGFLSFSLSLFISLSLTITLFSFPSLFLLHLLSVSLDPFFAFYLLLFSSSSILLFVLQLLAFEKFGLSTCLCHWQTRNDIHSIVFALDFNCWLKGNEVLTHIEVRTIEEVESI